MKIFSLIIAIFFTINAHSQFVERNSRPQYIPFELDNKYGLMDTFGNIYKDTGVYSFIEVFDNFSFYMVRSNSKEQSYHLFNAVSGMVMDKGAMIRRYPLCYIDSNPYFHYEINGKTALVSPNSAIVYQFNQQYYSLDVEILYDSLGENKQVIVVVKNNNHKNEFYKIDGNKLSKIKNIPLSDDYNVINTQIKSNDSYMSFPVGIIVKNSETKQPQKQKDNEDEFDVPFSKWIGKVYNDKFKFINNSYNREKELQKLFNYKVYIQSHMIGGKVNDSNSPASIFNHSYSVQLNEDLEFRKIAENVSAGVYKENYYLVKSNTEPVEKIVLIDKIFFRWKYLKNKYRLGTFELSENGSTQYNAFFDFEGKYLPKNKLMFPKKYSNSQLLDGLIEYVIK